MDLVKVYKKEFISSEYYIITMSLDGNLDNEYISDVVYCKSYETELVDLLIAINKVLKNWDATRITCDHEVDSWNCDDCGWIEDDTYIFKYFDTEMFRFEYDGHFGNSTTPSIEEIENAYRRIAKVKVDLSEF